MVARCGTAGPVDSLVGAAGWVDWLVRCVTRWCGQVPNTLDPLLEKLTRDYIDDADLTDRLHSLFKVSLLPRAV